ncbi:hypothetical protein [Nocardioides immobilis]|uniref:hypothetical protein n=1 Tax=Nocardioides immobilis TaxID=2049295 RepID=UPI001FE5CE71|nr:hypothetical protein [Nocardioides immobilis]
MGRAPLRQPAEAVEVVEREQGHRGMHPEEGGGRCFEAAAPGDPGDLLEPGHRFGVGGQRPAVEQRAGVDQGSTPDGVPWLELGGVATADRLEVAERELVQRRVPGEVGEALGLCSLAGHPRVHPGQPGHVVAGLVVGVRPRVGGVTGRRVRGQCSPRERHGVVVPPLLLAHEGEEAEEPGVVSVRRRCFLDDRPRLGRNLGHAGEGDRGHRDGQQHRVAGIGGQVREQRAVVTLEVTVDRVDVAALALARPAREPSRVVEPRGDVDVDAHLVAEQCQVGVGEGERRVVRERRGDPDVCVAAEAEQVTDAGDVRRRCRRTRGQRIAVVLPTTHACSLSRVPSRVTESVSASADHCVMAPAVVVQQ